MRRMRVPGYQQSGALRRVARYVSLMVLVVGSIGLASPFTGQVSARQTQPASAPPATREVLDQYCIGCHNARLRTADLALDGVDAAHPEADPELWERVIAKLEMP